MINRPIPPEAHQALVQVMALDPAFDSALVESVRSQQPRLLHLRFVEDVRNHVPLDMQGAVQTVILGAVSLARGREEFGIPVEDFVREIVSSELINASPSQRDRLLALFTTLLSTPALVITAKAYDLLVENDANFQSARVVTDVRPVFADTTDKPAVALIVHSLRLRVAETQQLRDVYVALDEIDLARLQDVLARAQSKATTLRRSFPDLRFPVLSEETTT